MSAAPLPTACASSLIPDSLRDVLDVASAVTCTFNPFGTLLAVGTLSGSVEIWDVEMLCKATTLEIGHDRIKQIDWSDDGHVVVVTSGKTVTRVEILHPCDKDKRHTVRVDGEIEGMALRGAKGRECVLTCEAGMPVVVDLLDRGQIRPLPALHDQKQRDGEILDGCGNQREQRLLPMAVFDRTCSKIVHAQEDGWIHVYDAILLEILDVCALPLGCRIAGIRIQRQSDLVVVFLVGMCPMIYMLDQQALSECIAVPMEEAKKRIVRNSQEGSVLRPGLGCLKPIGRLKHPLDALNSVTWDIGCLMKIQGTAEATHLACAPSASSKSPLVEQHLLHIWDLRTGELERILEGPKDSVRDICWHERCGSLVSISLTGKVFIWSKRQQQYWSTFDPNFQELEVNEEYIESETEFDAKPEADIDIEQEDGAIPMDVSEETEEEIDIFGPSDNSSLDTDDLTSKPLAHIPVDFHTPEANTNSESANQTQIEPEPPNKSENHVDNDADQVNQTALEDPRPKGARLKVHFRSKKVRVEERPRRRRRI